MRLLLTVKLLILLCSLPIISDGQHKEEVDARFLFNYYSQEGDHSAVTGGRGSQELQDRSLDINLEIPLDSLNQIRFFGHVNYYSSASSDKIDYNVSSASSSDIRLQLQVGYSHRNPVGHTSSIDLGNSLESDYLSRYLLLRREIPFTDNLGSFSIDIGMFLDHWALITAEELRVDRQFFKTDRRNTYQLGLAFTRMLSQNMQIGMSFQPVYQHGLLSTPFHRLISASDSVIAEYFPDNRIRIPASLSLDMSLTRSIYLNSSYRFYSDNFGVLAHSLALGFPVYLRNRINFSPFARFHVQKGARFFYEYGESPDDAIYRTSDFDLSALSSFKTGIALNMELLQKATALNELSLRAGFYSRSDGLKSYFFSLGARMLFAKKER